MHPRLGLIHIIHDLGCLHPLQVYLQVSLNSSKVACCCRAVPTLFALVFLLGLLEMLFYERGISQVERLVSALVKVYHY